MYKIKKEDLTALFRAIAAEQEPVSYTHLDGIFHDAWRVWCGRRMLKYTDAGWTEGYQR